MENTNENFTKFVSQYYGQKVLKEIDNECIDLGNYLLTLKSSFISLIETNKGKYYLELIPLNLITDEDAIYIAKLIQENQQGDYIVRRDEWGVHVSITTEVKIEQHIYIDFKYASITSNWMFHKQLDEDEFLNYEVNIGKIRISSKHPIPYIAIVDYLRSKSYAIPCNGLSVDEQINYGWVKLKTKL